MSDSKVAAICADRANTRLVLATYLVAANEEIAALRSKIAERESSWLRAADLTKQVEALQAEITALKAKPAATKIVARHDYAAERKARMAKNRAMTAAYFAAFPDERSVTPYQLEQFAAMQ